MDKSVEGLKEKHDLLFRLKLMVEGMDPPTYHGFQNDLSPMRQTVPQQGQLHVLFPMPTQMRVRKRDEAAV